MLYCMSVYVCMCVYVYPCVFVFFACECECESLRVLMYVLMCALMCQCQCYCYWKYLHLCICVLLAWLGYCVFSCPCRYFCSADVFLCYVWYVGFVVCLFVVVGSFFILEALSIVILALIYVACIFGVLFMIWCDFIYMRPFFSYHARLSVNF